jgi:hypothetical protein
MVLEVAKAVLNKDDDDAWVKRRICEWNSAHSNAEARLPLHVIEAVELPKGRHVQAKAMGVRVRMRPHSQLEQERKEQERQAIAAREILDLSDFA